MPDEPDWDAVRHAYECTRTPVVEIAAAHAMSVDRLHHQRRKENWAMRSLLAPGKYRLTGLLRGLRGTVPVSAGAGAKAMLIGNRTLAVDVPEAALGTTRMLRVHAGPRDGEGTTISVHPDPGPALPLAPVHLSARRDARSGDVVQRWIRRTRTGGDGWPVGDVPLDVAPEAYRVQMFEGETVVRTVEVGALGYLYTSSQQAADFGGLPESFDFSVQQLSPVLGPGHASTGGFR